MITSTVAAAASVVVVSMDFLNKLNSVWQRYKFVIADFQHRRLIYLLSIYVHNDLIFIEILRALFRAIFVVVEEFRLIRKLFEILQTLIETLLLLYIGALHPSGH